MSLASVPMAHCGRVSHCQLYQLFRSSVPSLINRKCHHHTPLPPKRQRSGLTVQPLQRLRQEDNKFKASLGNIVRVCLKIKSQRWPGIQRSGGANTHKVLGLGSKSEKESNTQTRETHIEIFEVTAVKIPKRCYLNELIHSFH